MSRFTALTAKDWMALKGVELDTIGNVLVVTGPNGAGKSSFCTALDCLVFGPKAAPDMPIRKGQADATLEGNVECGDLVFRIVRKIYRKKTREGEPTGEIGWTAKVSQVLAEGVVADLASPQTTIERLFGGRGARVTDFATLGKTAAGQREQIRMIKQMAGIDTAILDAKIDEANTERSAARRDAKAMRADIEACDTIPEGTPANAINIADLADELQALNNANGERGVAIATAHRLLVGADRDCANVRNENANVAREYVGKIERLAEAAKKAEDALNDAKAAHANWLDGIESRIATVDDAHGRAAKALSAAEVVCLQDVEPLRERLRTAETVNADVRNRQRVERLSIAASNATNAADLLAGQLARLAGQRSEMLTAANLGVEGLAVDDAKGCLTLNGVPLSQASESEALLVACRVYHAANPAGVIFLNGNGLDDDSMHTVTEWAFAEGVQLIIERLAADDGVEIVATEDGSVLADVEDGE